MQIDLRDKQILVLPANKKVSMVEFEDGTAEVYLDLTEDVLAFLYQQAAELGCEVDEVIRRAVHEYCVSQQPLDHLG